MMTLEMGGAVTKDFIGPTGSPVSSEKGKEFVSLVAITLFDHC